MFNDRSGDFFNGYDVKMEHFWEITVKNSRVIKKIGGYSMSKRLTKWLAVIMLMSVFLTACSSTKQTIQYEGDSKMQATITVKYSGGGRGL
ncbi:hypothetical protein D3C74_187370 [compost metagenome]